MLRIRAIKIEINTPDGVYGVSESFSEGVNIIKGDNTTGKSTLVQSIFYGLGLEELIGGRGEKTMQSVLKDVVKDAKGMEHKVLSSVVFLEISNEKEIVTTKRHIIHEFKDSRLVDVYKGAVLTEGKYPEFESMFLHDPGAAKDDEYGFHYFLEKFIGWDLPEVTLAKGRKSKLYIQSIFPACFIEQKVGWSDYLATIPNYGIREAKAKAVEFILNLDALVVDLKKSDIKEQKQLLKGKWEVLRLGVLSLARDGRCSVVGFPELPEIINSTESIYLTVIQNGIVTPLEDSILFLRNEFMRLEREAIVPTSNNVEIYENRLAHLKELLSNVDFRQSRMQAEQELENDKYKGFKKQLEEVERELLKNRHEVKLKKFGSELELHLAQHVCPTCNQEIKDMLLSQDIDQTPMRIEDNIEYLEAQKQMLEVYVKNQGKIIEYNDAELEALARKAYDTRAEIRELKRELTSDDRLPSEQQIEEKLIIKQRREFYIRLQDRFVEKLEELQSLSSEYRSILAEEALLPKESYSENDLEKLKDLKNNFKRLLKDFKYSSKDLSMVDISDESYTPVVSDRQGVRNYNIKFDSSASDFIRTIWAYTCSLLKVSEGKNGNHPGIVIFDEPEQHSMADNSTRNLLKELVAHQNSQSILAISFHEKERVYQEVTKGFTFNLIDLRGMLIKKLE